jgi:hypothetical protein
MIRSSSDTAKEKAMIKIFIEMKCRTASGHFYGENRLVPWMTVDGAERALEEAKRAEGAWGNHPDFVRAGFMSEKDWETGRPKF